LIEKQGRTTIKPPVLYAIPTPIGGAPQDALPRSALHAVRSLGDFAVENAKSARAFLGSLGLVVRNLGLVSIDAGEDLLAPLRAGRSMGLLSDAGCPAIADPGAALVDAAHREGFRVVPLVGPSSIVLALMASGLEGQRFAFCGYLPRDSQERIRRIRDLETRSRRERETEIFIETPYRNDVLLAAILGSCLPSTRLCLAIDLTLPGERVATRSIAEWRKSNPAVGKKPAVFLLFAG
jgi:16S rRNA (cytidine1402-2'-O)-methyltransferase